MLWLIAYLILAYPTAFLFVRRVPLTTPFRAAAVTLSPLWVPGLAAYYVTQVVIDVVREVRRVPPDQAGDGAEGAGPPVR